MERIDIKIGTKAIYDNVDVIIVKIIDINRVSVEEIESGIIHTIHISNLIPWNKEAIQIKDREIHTLPEKDWNKAKKRYEIIKPILDDRGNYRLIEEIANLNNIHVATIYRWIKMFEQMGNVSSLAGQQKTGGKGKSRLDPKIENIIVECIEKFYLNSNRRSINNIIKKINMQCRTFEISPPHPNTIRSRINNISEESKIRARHGSKLANSLFQPIIKNFPGADAPLSVIQIDHTKLDIILVDEHYRKPIERPWLTLAIDVFSRMVVGFYLSFDPPGALGTGLCVANSILPKEMWMEKMGVKGNWPCWGIMSIIHLDNAKEFRGDMLSRACENYGININFRPIATPHWGGHIERLLGTFSKEIHDLPGTTFSNINDRKNYNSQDKASLTIGEFETWLCTYIVNVYHQKRHSSIGMSPLQKYNQGIFGTPTTQGVGVFPRIFDERRLRLDFMPFVKRSIQEYGIVIDYIHYYDEVLRKYIHAKEHKNNKLFLFRRDPRDISIVYFYDPELNEYFEIPYKNTSQPPMSIWEYREAVRYLKESQVPDITEDIIFEAFKHMEEIEMKAIGQTKKVKRLSRIAMRRDEFDIHGALENKQKTTENPSKTISIITPFDDLDDDTFTS